MMIGLLIIFSVVSIIYTKIKSERAYRIGCITTLSQMGCPVKVEEYADEQYNIIVKNGHNSFHTWVGRAFVRELENTGCKLTYRVMEHG